MNKLPYSQTPSKNSYNLRIFLLMLVITIVVSLVGIKLFNLQILNHAHYQSLASNQQGLKTTINPQRGEIYLWSENSNNQPLLVATNLSKNMVFALPKEIRDRDQTSAKLAPLLDFSASDLRNRLSAQSYTPLKKELSDVVSAKIKALKLPGIYLEAQDIRFYPEKNLAAQVLGFLGFKGNERVGQYGVEGAYQEQLAGQMGELGTDSDPTGRWISLTTRNFTPAEDGDDVYLTLDPAIQFKAQQVLSDAVTKHGADGGSVVILNPKDGAVLAMASMPDFDLNTYGKVKDQSIFSNKVLSADYEPGSIFKPITMAAAINEGKVTPETTYDNEGVVQVDDKQIKNSDPNIFHGLQNMITVLNESLNTGAYFAEQQIGNDVFKKYVETCRFGKTVDFECPGRCTRHVKNLTKTGKIYYATARVRRGIR